MYDRAARIALAFARFLMRKTRDSRFDLFPLSLSICARLVRLPFKNIPNRVVDYTNIYVIYLHTYIYIHTYIHTCILFIID
mgnify:FL=1|jgi:hypothetical protein